MGKISVLTSEEMQAKRDAKRQQKFVKVAAMREKAKRRETARQDAIWASAMDRPAIKGAQNVCSSKPAWTPMIQAGLPGTNRRH
jgi:hypothetical protein